MLDYGGVILTAFTPNFSLSSGFFAEHATNSTSSICIRPQESVRRHLGCSFLMGKKQRWCLPILVSLSRQQGLKISCDSRVHQRLDPWTSIYLHHVRLMSCWNIIYMPWSRDLIADATYILVHSQNLEEVDDCSLSSGVWSLEPACLPGRSTSPR